MMNGRTAWLGRLGMLATANQITRRGMRRRRSNKFMLPWQTRARNNSTGRSVALGFGLGALAMYLFDATWGNRRRALARDQVTGMFHKTEEALDKTARDASRRAVGLVAEAKSHFGEEDVTDQVLEARVREALGRVVSHPKAVDVLASDGRVTLSGQILRREVDRLLDKVHEVRGVHEVENLLEVHDKPGDLQGGSRRNGDRPEFAQENWTPAVRVLGGLAGLAVSATTFTIGGVPRLAGGVVGLGLLARSITNYPVKRLLGVGAGRRAVDVHKTININAPVDEVFNFWSNFENFPRFMSNVREVRDLGDGRSHWVVDGPGGMSAQWNARITAFEPDRLIAWRSEPDTLIGNAGIIRFDPAPNGGTRVTVRMSYNPPAGALGHAVATLFNSNPKQAMNEDLVRLKALIETGKTRVGGAQVLREEVEIVRTEEQHASTDALSSSEL